MRIDRIQKTYGSGSENRLICYKKLYPEKFPKLSDIKRNFTYTLNAFLNLENMSFF